MVDLGPGMSHAVVARRHEPQNSLDDFPTPPWATRALMEHVIKPSEFGHGIQRSSVWEPACGRGYMSRPLGEYFLSVLSTDIADYGWRGQHGTCDYTSGKFEPANIEWVITNPPFKRAHDFINHGHRTRKAVAVLVRTSFVEGVRRFRQLYERNPPDIIGQFSERVPMVKGRVDKNASTATAYCWLVWGRNGSSGDNGSRTKFVWIPPCRKDLERKEDYQTSSEWE